MRIKAAVTREKGKLAIEELNLAEPKLGEVVVKMVASGVCHTDSSTMEMFVPTKFPIVLGHEGVGIVEKVGEGVKTLKPGDHVIMSFPSCGCCEKCVEGHPYACERSTELFFFGTYADEDTRITDDNGVKVGSLFGQGAFATHCVIDERNAVKVDPDVDLKALCSLGCGVQTGVGTVLNRMKPNPGDTFVVFGCGAVGISGIMGAKLADPARQVVAVLGDGAFQMNMMELGTIAEYQIPVKVVVMRNEVLGLVRQYQHFNYHNHYSVTNLGSSPKLEKIAEAYDMKYYRLDDDDKIQETLADFLADDTSALLECIIDPNEVV